MAALLTVQGVLSKIEKQMLDTEGIEAFRKENAESRKNRHTGETISMKATLELFFKEKGVKDANWSYMEDGLHFTVSFTVRNNEEHDEILEFLTSKGFGSDENSHVYHQSLRGNLINMNKRVQEEKKMSMIKNLVNTVQSRKSVIDVIQTTKSRTEFTCDYVIELATATVIAAASLASDNIAGLVASMLLSPLLDPILGILFGLSFGIQYMVKSSAKSMALSLFIILIVGFFSGPLCFAMSFFTDFQFPTSSIADRITFAQFFGTLVLATFSAPNLTSALLNDNQGAKVGNAISLSLLPPVANSGLLLFHAFITQCLKVFNVESGVCSYRVSFYNTHINTLVATQETCSLPLAMLRGAGVSCLITAMNVVIIIVVGLVIFKIKKIRPNSLFRGEIKKFVMEVQNEDILRTIQTLNPKRTFYEENLEKYCQIQNIDPKRLTENERYQCEEDFKKTVNGFPIGKPTGKFFIGDPDQEINLRNTSSFYSKEARKNIIQKLTKNIEEDIVNQDEQDLKNKKHVTISVLPNETLAATISGNFPEQYNSGYEVAENDMIAIHFD